MPASEGDSFMAVLSSARELPLQGKNGAISVLDATITFGDIPDTGRYWKWLLNMEEMGYLAIDLERKKVAVEGQFLCRSCVEDNEVYLSGARTPDFTRFIKNTCDRYSLYLDVDRYSQSYPNRIRIRGSEANLRKLANEAKLPLSDAPTSYILALHKVALSDLVETRKLEERGLEHQWIEERFIPGTPPPLEQIALVAPKTTDLLSIRPSSVSPGLNMNILSPGAAVKAAYASAAFVLRGVATDILDIDAEELDICHLRSVPLMGGGTGERKSVGEIVISDFHPNGSGFTYWLHENWRTCLNAILKPAGGDSFADMLLSPEHARDCPDACYRCLKNFRNMSYHALLDWRLGVSVLKTLATSDYMVGLNGNLGTPELRDWLQGSMRQRDRVCEAYFAEGVVPGAWGMLAGFDMGKLYRVIIAHELWNTNEVLGDTVLSEAIEAARDGIEGRKLCFATPFNLARRPSWTLHNLHSMEN